MILVFDLDDTLYEELTFVESGFMAVCHFLSRKYYLNKEQLFKRCQEIHNQQGRGKIFDKILEENNLYSKVFIKKLLSIYRLHNPKIQLYADALDFLKKYKSIPKYIVTDGNKVVQANKIKALGLEKHIKKAFITHRYGIHHAKPSPYCFFKICELEKVEPSQVIYIGDNPNKDFVGIKPHGFRTIRILKGNYKELHKNANFDADAEIADFNQLDLSLSTNLKVKNY